jgi:hypothetical protein
LGRAFDREETKKASPGVISSLSTIYGKKHRVDVNSLEEVKPRPEGFEWIEAYLL